MNRLVANGFERRRLRHHQALTRRIGGPAARGFGSSDNRRHWDSGFDARSPILPIVERSNARELGHRQIGQRLAALRRARPGPLGTKRIDVTLARTELIDVGNPRGDRVIGVLLAIDVDQAPPEAVDAVLLGEIATA